jgi:hypothetical protein
LIFKEIREETWAAAAEPVERLALKDYITVLA